MNQCHYGGKTRYSSGGLLVLKSPGNFSGPESCFVFVVIAFKITVLIILKIIQRNNKLTKQNWLVCRLGTVLLFNRFWFLNLSSGLKSSRVCRETSPGSSCCYGFERKRRGSGNKLLLSFCDPSIKIIVLTFLLKKKKVKWSFLRIHEKNFTSNLVLVFESKGLCGPSSSVRIIKLENSYHGSIYRQITKREKIISMFLLHMGCTTIDCM